MVDAVVLTLTNSSVSALKTSPNVANCGMAASEDEADASELAPVLALALEASTLALAELLPPALEAALAELLPPCCAHAVRASAIMHARAAVKVTVLSRFI